ncbi:phosphatidylinositol kinase [Vibrio breoganii]
MTNSIKMPYARLNNTGRIISILEAVRGNECNCHCLSCGCPVTARKADINQWHFAHRTDDINIKSECHFSPVTAIALILRQQLPHLQSFNLDDFSFDNANWEFDTKIDGLPIDAIVHDPNTLTKVIAEIPYASSKKGLHEPLVQQVDGIIKIDTSAIAESMMAKSSKPELLTPEEVLTRLLENWGDWVELLYPNSFIPEGSLEPEQISNQIQQPKERRSANTINCACCNARPGKYRDGLLCEACVRKHVGSSYPNLTEMEKAFR